MSEMSARPTSFVIPGRGRLLPDTNPESLSVPLISRFPVRLREGAATLRNDEC